MKNTKQKQHCTCEFGDRYFGKDGSKCIKCGKEFPLKDNIKTSHSA